MNRISITGGRVVDPKNGIDEVRDIYIENGSIVSSLSSPDTTVDASGCYVLPGLIDFHTHLYGASAFGIDPDLLLPTGVTSAVDAGTSGYINFEDFYSSVLTRSKLNLKAFINLSPIGQPGGGINEPLGRSLISDGLLEEMVERHRDTIIGVKVRISRPIVGELELDPLFHAIEVAEKLGLPINVHVTNPPRMMSEIAPYFRKGDIFTHVYEGTGHTIIEDGKVAESVWEAKKRGVIFDSANGRSNFIFSVAETALKEGFFPDIISTDSTALNFSKPYVVKNLPFIMSKYLALGMSLDDVVAAVTSTPAKLMGEERIGNLSPGSFGDVAIVRIEDKKTLFKDTGNSERWADQVIRPVMVIRKGEFVYTSPDFS